MHNEISERIMGRQSKLFLATVMAVSMTWSVTLLAADTQNAESTTMINDASLKKTDTALNASITTPVDSSKKSADEAADHSQRIAFDLMMVSVVANSMK